MDNIFTVIAGFFSGSLFTALVTKNTSDNSIRVDNITKERKKWRDDLRDGLQALHRLYQRTTLPKSDKQPEEDIFPVVFHSYHEAKCFFQCRLNPNDEEDRKILDELEELQQKKNFLTLKNIDSAVSTLLKFEWNRAKYESTPHFVGKLFLILLCLVAAFCIIFKGFLSDNLAAFKDYLALCCSVLVFLGITVAIYGIISFVVGKIVRCHKDAECFCQFLNLPYRKPPSEYSESKDDKNEKDNDCCSFWRVMSALMLFGLICLFGFGAYMKSEFSNSQSEKKPSSSIEINETKTFFVTGDIQLQIAPDSVKFQNKEK
ncbi:MAG: hypothetical protein ACI38O_03830 [Fibrobacter intestinalis]|uniref:hypothetical protein n=1 Tax=Fibrobacter intestinalis TaxID=28122 RepID=UPI003F0F2128